jgi:flagellar hook-associated protein FlgK
MSSISSIALSGVQAATAQFQTSANNIANPNSGGSLVNDVVNATTAQTGVELGLKMIRADHDMTQQLIDILA